MFKCFFQSVVCAVISILFLSSLAIAQQQVIGNEPFGAGFGSFTIGDNACQDCQISPHPSVELETSQPGLKSYLKDQLGIEANGMLWHSVNTNSRNPTNPPSGAGGAPGGLFLYRADEYMFNWLGVSLAKPAESKTSGVGFGWNSHVVYGTDYFSLQSRGLELEGDGTNKWNSDFGAGLVGGLHGLALPELYVEAKWDKWHFSLGKFFHPMGFSRYLPNLNSIGNTRSYSAIFGEFSTVTGVQGNYQMNDQLTFTSAVHQGDANWDDNNDKLSSYFGFDWMSRDGLTELRFVADVGREDDAGLDDQYVHALVFQQRFCEKWLYLAHHNFGWIENGAGAGQNQEWYTLEQQLVYEFNEKFVFGVRYEFFIDSDGATVAPTPGAGTYHLLDCGGTYKLSEKVWLRPELRWEWFEPESGVVAPGPFGDGNERSQFIGSFSMFAFF